MNETDPPSQNKKVKSNEQPPLFKKIDSEEFNELYDTRKLYLGIWRHLLLISLCAVLWAVIGFWGRHKLTNTYQAEAIVIFHEKEKAPEALEGAFNLTNFTMATVLDIINTPKHLEAVKTRLGLDMEPEAIGAMIKIPTPRSESNMIRIIARADNPHLAVDVVNALANATVKDSQEYTREQLRENLENYRFQLGVVQRTLASKLGDIESFKTKNQFFEMDPRAVKVLEEVEGAKQARDQAALDYEGLVEQYNNLQRQVESLPDYVPINRESTDSPLQIRIMSLETQLAEARGRYTSNNPKVRQMEQELNELMRKSKNKGDPEEEKFYQRNQLKDTLSLEILHLKGKVLSAQKVKEQLESRVNALQAQLQSLPVTQMELVKLLQAKDLTEDQVRYMAKAAEITQLMVNMPKGSIQLYQLADKANPWKEGLWVDLLPLLGLLFGAGFGICLALVIEMVDSKLCTPRQIEMHYTIPCVATIPELPALTKNNAEERLLFFVRQIAEVIEQMIRKAQGPVSIINFASTEKGEGKSIFSYLLTKYFNGIDQSALLLELDWRSNRLAASSQETKGIVDYLEGSASFDEVLSLSAIPRVRLGKRDPRMKELLKSERMERFLEEARSRYALIFVDSPGVIEEDYATNIAEFSDSTFLLLNSSKIKKSKADAALSVLDRLGIRPFGIILNRIKSIYIDDARIKLERKKSNKQLFRWKRSSK